MIAVSNFFQQATQYLCGTLNMGEALEKFFPYLQECVPVTRFGLGRRQPGCFSQEVVAMCGPAANNIHILNKGPAPYSADQKNFFASNKTVWGEHDIILVEQASHPVARFFGSGAGEYSTAHAPFVALKLNYESDMIGGAIFEYCLSRPLNQHHIDLLHSLQVPLQIMLSNCFRHRELESLKDQIWQENKKLQQELAGLTEIEVVGARGDLAELLHRAKLAAAVNVPVLIDGETGTGKELIARAVHEFSPRRQAPFIAVNCGGIPPSLIDSELFGHVKGAFTGAINNHKGRFERAHQGTLFLDEIGELPLDIQARLLRVLQDSIIERVGGNATIPVNFRLVAATHRNLPAMVAQGTFREDLFYRLNVVALHVPPLRERPRDIPQLVEHCIRNSANKFGIRPPTLADGEMQKLLAYPWPGNVRELQNTVEQALVLNPRGPLTFQTQKTSLTPQTPLTPPSWEQAQKTYFQSLLAHSNGRITGTAGAAALSGINPSTLRSKLHKLNMLPG